MRLIIYIILALLFIAACASCTKTQADVMQTTAELQLDTAWTKLSLEQCEFYYRHTRGGSEVYCDGHSDAVKSHIIYVRAIRRSRAQM